MTAPSPLPQRARDARLAPSRSPASQAARGRWRSLARIAIATVLVAAGAHAIGAESYAPLTVKLVPQRLSERAYFVQGEPGVVSTSNNGFISNAGFVVTDEGVVVFDALGSPSLGAELLRQIRMITPKPVRRVIVSHYHADHFYGLAAFKQAGAEIFAHRLVRDYLASDAPRARLEERRNSLAPWVDERMQLIPPDVYLDGEASFKLGGVDFRIFNVGPAHTPEDLMMLVEQEGVLFAGDLMFAGRVPYVGNGDSKGWLASIERLAASGARVIVGGHGPASTNAARDLATTRDYLSALRREMGSGVQDMLTFEETFRRADFSRFRSLPAFDAAHRINAFNTFLLMEREALGAK